MGGMEPQGISRVGQTVLARLMESQIWHQPAGSVSLLGEGSEMGQWPLLALVPETSVSSCISLMPFKLLPWCWCSEGVSQSKFLYGFFKGNCLGLKQFLLPSQSLLIFAAVSYGDLSSWHQYPGLWGLVWGWDSWLSRYPSHIFIHHRWIWDQPILHVCLCLLPVWINVVSLIP